MGMDANVIIAVALKSKDTDELYKQLAKEYADEYFWGEVKDNSDKEDLSLPCWFDSDDADFQRGIGYEDESAVYYDDDDVVIVSAKVGDWDDPISWERMEKAKSDIEALAKKICDKYGCTSTLFVTANYN